MRPFYNSLMRTSDIEEEIRAWAERSDMSRQYGKDPLARACSELAARYKKLLGEAENATESEELVSARNLRRKIEAAEQHRTMCAEHGLNDAAIDATYEIEELEQEIVALITDAEL